MQAVFGASGRYKDASESDASPCLVRVGSQNRSAERLRPIGAAGLCPEGAEQIAGSPPAGVRPGEGLESVLGVFGSICGEEYLAEFHGGAIRAAPRGREHAEFVDRPLALSCNQGAAIVW